MGKANDKRVEHYKKNEKEGKQHWDRMWEMYREAWFVGNITKYVERYRDKDGIKDLKKALHYLEKLIELEEDEEKLKEAKRLTPTEVELQEKHIPDIDGQSL